MKEEKMIFNKIIAIGKIDNSPTYLECTIMQVDLKIGNTKETTNHKKVSKYKSLSISGHNKHMAGQIVDSLKPVLTPKLKRIIKIWKQCHLNDLTPNCVHQKSFNCNLKGFTKRAKEQTSKCPNNYAYGSKWLVAILSQSVIDEIMFLFSNYKVQE